MLLRGLGIGLLLVALLPARGGAQEELPVGVVNVVLRHFGQQVASGDYGLANVEPLGVVQSVGRGQETRIVRTPRELRLSRRGVARFQVLLGDTDTISFWIESAPVRGMWQLSLSAVLPNGYREPVFGEDLLREGLYVVQVPPRALLEFQVTAKGQKLRPSKWFQFTVSPGSLSVWNDFRPVPFTYQRRVILP